MYVLQVCVTDIVHPDVQGCFNEQCPCVAAGLPEQVKHLRTSRAASGPQDAAALLRAQS